MLGVGSIFLMSTPVLRFAAEIEALEQVISKGGHLAILAAEQFLQRRGGIGCSLGGQRELDLKSIDSKEHQGSPVVRGARHQQGCRVEVPAKWSFSQGDLQSSGFAARHVRAA